jgi:hypothetical protein
MPDNRGPRWGATRFVKWWFRINKRAFGREWPRFWTRLEAMARCADDLSSLDESMQKAIAEQRNMLSELAQAMRTAEKLADSERIPGSGVDRPR